MVRALLTVAGVFASVPAAWGQSTSLPARLAGADYAEIQTTYGRSLHAVGEDGGSAFADAFTVDGAIAGPAGRVAGRGQLAEHAVSRRGLRHWITNLAIEASSDGALGWAYVIEGRGLDFQAGALYRDEWIRTPEGWRVRHRDVHPGNRMPPRDHYLAPSNVNARTFTPRDYFEIKTLLTRYNLGWDNAASSDSGRLTTLSFTPDSIFEGLGRATRLGHEGLIAQAMEHAQTGGLHHWDTTPWLDLEDGAVAGFNYVLLTTVSPSGSPVAIRTGGTLAHRFVRTDEGWLITFRRNEGNTAPEVAWPEPGFGLVGAEVVAETGTQGNRDGQLSAVDFIQIEQLYHHIAVAFDSARDRGAAFARGFTADGVMTQAGTTVTGLRALEELAAANPTGLRTWLSNLVLEPTTDGATGRVYVLVKGPDAEVPVADVGTFEDELVRAGDGWQFKRRVYRSEIPGATNRPAAR